MTIIEDSKYVNFVQGPLTIPVLKTAKFNWSTSSGTPSIFLNYYIRIS